MCGFERKRTSEAQEEQWPSIHSLPPRLLEMAVRFKRGEDDVEEPKEAEDVKGGVGGAFGTSELTPVLFAPVEEDAEAAEGAEGEDGDAEAQGASGHGEPTPFETLAVRTQVRLSELGSGGV